MKIIVSQEIENVCPGFVGAAVEAQVVNSAYCAELWDEIHTLEARFRQELTTESLKEQSGIAATRRVYKACGKDPSRYRPASEQLIRRMLHDKFVGDTLTLGIGREGEPYEGIGRGMLNIAGLPVYRDAQGGVGTPTSDNERTKMTIDTTHLVVLINGYDGQEQLVVDNARFIQDLLRRYCQSDGGTVTLYR